MSQEFIEVLKRLAPDEPPDRLDRTARELQGMLERLTVVIESVGDAPGQQQILAEFNARALAALKNEGNGPKPMKITPELREWALRTFNEEECVAGIKEIEATGGVELRDFIDELEQEIASRE
jgi:hypothetical protein